MEKNLSLQKKYYPLMLIAGIIAVGLRIAACFTSFNFKTGYFDGKWLIYSSGAVVIISIAFALTYLFRADKDVNYLASFKTAATFVPIGIIFTATVFFSLNIYLSRISAIQQQTNVADSIKSVIAILAIPSLIYLALNCFITSTPSTARSAMGICFVALLSFYAAYLYFDTKMPLNAPNKIVDQMAFLFSGLFFLYEIRISLSRCKWRAYVSFAMIGALLNFYSSVPSILLFLIKGQTLSLSIYENILSLTLGIFMLTRLYLIYGYREDKESEFVTFMKEAIEVRRAELEEISSEDQSEESLAGGTQEKDAPVQISLFDLQIEYQKAEEKEDPSDTENNEN